jgi:hypothetical protein
MMRNFVACTLHQIIRLNNSRKMRGHVTRMGEMINAYKILARNLKGRDHPEDVGAYGRKILEWILGKWGGKVWTGFMWIRKGASSRVLGTQ